MADTDTTPIQNWADYSDPTLPSFLSPDRQILRRTALLMRTLYNGLDTLAEKELFLIRRPGEPTDCYEARLAKAVYKNHLAEAVNNNAAMLGQFQEVDIFPEFKAQGYDQNFDLLGNSFSSFCQSIAETLILQGCCGVIIDRDQDAQRPYARILEPVDVFSPQVNLTKGKKMIQRVAIRRFSDRQYKNFGSERWVEFWVYYADGSVRIWEASVDATTDTQDGTGLKERAGDLRLLTNAKQPPPELPIIWFSTRETAPLELVHPPFKALAELSLLWMNKESELSYSEMITNIPFLIRKENGQYDKQNPDPIKVGANSIYDLPADQYSDVRYCSPDAASQALTNQRLGELENQIREEGLSMVTGDSHAQMSATESTIRANAGRASLNSIATDFESGVSRMLSFYAMFSKSTTWTSTGNYGSIVIDRNQLNAANRQADANAIAVLYAQRLLRYEEGRQFMLELGLTPKAGFNPDAVEDQSALKPINNNGAVNEDLVI